MDSMQVELTANFKKEEVVIKQIGGNPSKVVGHFLKKGDTYTLGPGGSFELLEGHYKYHVHFGQRVPESVLRELEVAGPLEEENEEEEREDAVSQVAAGSRKRTHSSRNGEGSPHSSTDSTPVKHARLDIPNSSTPRGPVVRAKPQQKSLEAFYSAKDSHMTAGGLKGEWTEVGTMMVFQYGSPNHNSKIAAFDLDTTLIDTASGKKFATGPTDWKFMKNVLEKLRSLDKEGFRVVIVSNQLGIPRGKPTKMEFRQKTEAIASRLQLPLLLLASTSRDVYRKPSTGMWSHLVREENGGVEVDKEESFYVGDAAGRAANWRPGQHAHC